MQYLGILIVFVGGVAAGVAATLYYCSHKRAYEWTCGHVAGAVCAECYHILARCAHELAEENFALRERIDELEKRNA